MELRELQLTQLDILRVFDETCKEMKVNYSLAFGTLLGAVRHEGFIPWDDDVDVMMKREDYDRFVQEANNMLPDGYFVQSNFSDENYPLDFAKLIIEDLSLSVVESLSLDIKHGIFIDIFPVDRCSSNRVVDLCDRAIASAARFVSYSVLDEQFESGFMRRVLRTHAQKLVEKRGVRPFVQRIEKVRRKRNVASNKMSYYYYTGDIPLKFDPSKRMPIAFIDNLTKLKFEGEWFMAVEDYDTLLTAIYGDYMTPPPVEERKPSHELRDSRSS